jgi:hypothetical protein
MKTKFRCQASRREEKHKKCCSSVRGLSCELHSRIYISQRKSWWWTVRSVAHNDQPSSFDDVEFYLSRYCIASTVKYCIISKNSSEARAQAHVWSSATVGAAERQFLRTRWYYFEIKLTIHISFPSSSPLACIWSATWRYKFQRPVDGKVEDIFHKRWIVTKRSLVLLCNQSQTIKWWSQSWQQFPSPTPSTSKHGETIFSEASAQMRFYPNFHSASYHRLLSQISLFSAARLSVCFVSQNVWRCRICRKPHLWKSWYPRIMCRDQKGRGVPLTNVKSDLGISRGNVELLIPLLSSR